MIEQTQPMLLRKSLAHIRSLKQALKREKVREPLAVISMACRFPGGCNTPEKFWNLLKAGQEGLSDVPSKRWDNRAFYDEEVKPNKLYIQQGNFLTEDVSLFDPKLFNISPREAEEMDPQQRLLLELTWEAMERAGQAPGELEGKSAGTFIGIIGSEYAMLPRDPEKTSPYSITGVTSHMASGRIAHVFGFHGPALSFDIACSSSLVAIHQACESLYNDECELAVAGGVGLMLRPQSFVGLCQMQALSRDGRCKPFSANGDGYGRGEGAGLIVLKRLSAAQRAQDPILALIQGSAVNHDGASSGLTVPNGQAQKALLKQAIQRAGIEPEDISYLEAHGTGTALGDPIEFESLKQVFGQNRRQDNPLMMGTCKANIGHLEAAAGIAGVIKTVLCLQHKAIPPHINCPELNPRVKLEAIPALLPSSYRDWETPEGAPRLAGVSSFGFSGTNAHVIVKEAPETCSESPAGKTDRPLHILTLSAQNPEALSELTEAYRHFLTNSPSMDIGSLAFTANAGRSHFAHRMACVGSDQDELLSGLVRFQETQKPSTCVYYDDAPSGKAAKITVFFPGEMIEEIKRLPAFLDTTPYFRKTWEKCEELFEPHIHKSLVEVNSNLEDPSVKNTLSHAALTFSFAYASFRLLEHWGIQIHSVYAQKDGLYSMTAASGLLPLEEAVPHLVHRYAPESFAELPRHSLTMPRVRVIWPGKKKALNRSDLTDEGLIEQAYDQTSQPQDVKKLLPTENAILCELHTTPCLLKQLYGEALTSMPYKMLYDIASIENGFVHAAAQFYSLGHGVDWKGYDEGSCRRKVPAPTYPFRKRSYWIPRLEEGYEVRVPQPISSKTRAPHPFIGQLQVSPSKVKQVHYKLSLSQTPELKDTHGVVHIGYLLEMLQSGMEKSGTRDFRIREMAFEVALMIPDTEEVEVQLLLEPAEVGLNFSFHSRNQKSEQWTKHVHGAVDFIDQSEQKRSLTAFQEELKKGQSGLVFYQSMEERGIKLGRSVQWIEYVWSKAGEALAQFRMATDPEQSSAYQNPFHPGIWDACAQLFHATLAETVAGDSSFMVTQLGELTFEQAELTTPLWCHACSSGMPNEKGLLQGSLTLYTDKGGVLARSKNYQMKELTVAHKEALRKASGPSLGQRNEEFLAVMRGTASEVEQIDHIENYLRTNLSGLLKLPSGELSVTESLLDMGMDSLMGLEFKNKLDQGLGLDISVGMLIQGPSITELSEELRKQLVCAGLQERAAKGKGPTDSLFRTLTEYSLDKKKWIRSPKRKQAELRLYCFPYGGGAASIYRDWQGQMSDKIEVVPVHLPGREDRLLETPIEEIEEYSRVLTEVLASELDHPYALYGHSVGALIAYGWALHLQECKLPLPCQLFAGAFTSPYLPNSYLRVIRKNYQQAGCDHIPSLKDLFDSVEEKRLEALYPLLEHAEEIAFLEPDNKVMDVFLPMMIADGRLVDTYRFPKNNHQLSVPITALHGSKDDRVTLSESKHWERLTNRAFSLQVFEGDHFFIHQDQAGENVTALIADKLMIDPLPKG